MARTFSSVAVNPGISGTRSRRSQPLSASMVRFFRISALSAPVYALWSAGSASFTSAMIRSVTGRNALSVSVGTCRQVSMAVLMPCALQAASSSSENAAGIVHSPPDSVTPPPEALKNTRSFSTSRRASSTVIGVASKRSAPVGQAFTQSPQRVHFLSTIDTPFSSKQTAPSGQAATQALQLTQRCLAYHTWMSGFSPSGFWHHAHRKGQPFRKNTVRMPSPSLMPKRLISKTFALVIRRRKPCG